MSTFWVRPTLPHSEINVVFPLLLRGTDLNFKELSVMLILCGPLNSTQVITALVKTLNYYPHITSRLQNTEGSLSLIEGKDGIPLTFVETNEPYDHYAPQGDAPEHLFDSVSVDPSGSNEPLCRLRVTFCHASNETYIGLSFGHVLGDGGCIYQFTHTWSQYYQGLAPIFGRPTWDKYKTAPPDADISDPQTVAFIDRHLPFIKVPYPIFRLVEMTEGLAESFERTDILFTANQVKHIHQVANAWPGKAGFPGNLSTQDSLTAYIITVYNQCIKVPIVQVSNIVNHRGVSNPESLKNSEWRIPGPWAVGNALSLATTSILAPEEVKSIGAIAWNIRRSIHNARNYNYLKQIVSVANLTWGRMVKEQELPKLWEESRPVFNSVGKLWGPKCHFGFGSERTRFLFYETRVGYIRFLAASPIKLADGSWHSNEGNISVVMPLPRDIREKFMATLSLELNSLIFPQNLIRREKRALVSQGLSVKL